MMRAALLLLLGCWASGASAHRPSDAFLTLHTEQGRVAGQWEIALRDLYAAFSVDANGDGALTWGELRVSHARLADELRALLQLRADGQPCALEFPDLLIHQRLDGPYAWFALSTDCSTAPATLEIRYSLLFAQDPSHRGLLVVESGGLSHSAVLSPSHNSAVINLSKVSSWRVVRDYLREGVHHIWIGVDHILFLLALLVPCVLRRENGRWQGVERLRPALVEVIAVVTAFTAAHSVTLTLAAVGVLRLPSALVESAIALSVLFSALNNLFPIVTRRRWSLAFGFGLIHGFGFASVLGGLGLPAGAKLLALLAFNIGVEAGQLAIVVLAVPLAYAMRHHWSYRDILLRGGSAAVGFMAVFWFLQRSGI